MSYQTWNTPQNATVSMNLGLVNTPVSVSKQSELPDYLSGDLDQCEPANLSKRLSKKIERSVVRHRPRLYIVSMVAGLRHLRGAALALIR